jgi:aspartyl-tRNA(Asn)/glutamyl-tRNA(Gln) amidotransferase subunit A
MKHNLYYARIGQLAPRIQGGDISPREIVDVCLARIDALNQKLNAFITILGDAARERAREAEAEIKAGKWRGPLHGIPVGIKDFYDTEGIRTTAAFERFNDRIPKKDAVGVKNLKDAGAIILGKTNMHTLGMGTTGLESFFGPVQNPWNSAYIPGGSSSGSAAAVAAGLCYATLDTDAIGSCRLPAACCGVVGFKGTYGLISAKGILEGEKADEVILWLSHPGLTTRSVEDTVAVLNALAEPPDSWKKPDLHRSQPKPLRVGKARNFTADAQINAAFETAVETIRSLGHAVIPAAAPLDTPPFGDVHAIEADRKAIAGRAYRDIDVLVLPTTTSTVLTVEAARGNAQALSPPHTMFANYFGLPAVSVPCGWDEHGLPIGLQVVGKPWDEATVLWLAHQYQSATQLESRVPIP